MQHLKHIEKARNLLQKYWKYSDFRIHQREVLDKLFNEWRIIGLLPTGGGKSICYQVPSLLFEGITIVISPLISLMEDQVEALKSIGIKAEALHSGHHIKDIDRILDNCIYGDIKLLYVSPERLSQELFRTRVRQMIISMIAIDEAHCISQWGHDFRPSYLQIGAFIEEFQPAYCIALTATATEKVITEIQLNLFKDQVALIRGSFIRHNIKIHFHHSENKVARVRELVQKQNKSIVYARNRRLVQMIAQVLSNQGVAAQFYHAGLSYKEKKKIQSEFKDSKLQAVVATNAFGMGIDVSDVRQVIHYDIPPSVEEYYQEIGRAGRDGLASEAHFLISNDDLKFNADRVAEQFPPFDFCCKIYKGMHVFYNIGLNEGMGKALSLNYKSLSEYLKEPVKKVLSVLRFWQKIGFWELSFDDKKRHFVQFNLPPNEVRSMISQAVKYSNLLDYMVRNNEFIFSEWVEINLGKIGKKINLTTEELELIFQALRSERIVKLRTLDAGPRILVLKNRYRVSDLSDFKMKYDFLKNTSRRRAEDMHGLIHSKQCRMNYILNYFGETTNVNCGNCDRCLDTEGTQVDYIAIQRNLEDL